MRWFRKKKVDPEPTPSLNACELFGHMWQDFPWYIEDDYNGNYLYSSKITIFEPYLCRICHQLEFKKLFEEKEALSRKQHDAKLQHIKEQYKDYIKPYPIVMDMVHDAKMVDREKLKYWEQLHSGKAATPIDCQLQITTNT